MTKSLLHLAADRYAAQYDDAHPPSAEQLLHDLTFYDGLALYSNKGEALLQSLRSGNVEQELIKAILEEISPEEISQCCITPSTTTISSQPPTATDAPCSGE